MPDPENEQRIAQIVLRDAHTAYARAFNIAGHPDPAVACQAWVDLADLLQEASELVRRTYIAGPVDPAAHEGAR